MCTIALLVGSAAAASSIGGSCRRLLAFGFLRVLAKHINIPLEVASAARKMKPVFASFHDCVVDAVMAAAGAYGSAALLDVFSALAGRQARYYYDGEPSSSAHSRER